MKNDRREGSRPAPVLWTPTRPEIQKIKGGFRKQVVHPVDPTQRLSITGRSESDVLEQAKYLQTLRFEVKHGIKTPKEAMRIVARRYAPAHVKEIWDRYIETRPEGGGSVARSTWKNRFAERFGDKLADELDEIEMRTWEKEEQKKGLSAKTIVNAYDVLAAAFRLEMRSAAPRLDALPWGAWRPDKGNEGRHRHEPKREACRSLEELESLVAAALRRDEKRHRRGLYADLSWRVMVVTLGGLRQGEGAGLGWDCCHIDEGLVDPSASDWVHVKYQAKDSWTLKNPAWTRPLDPPKDGERKLALHPAVGQALRELRAYQQKRGIWRPDGPVFPVRGGEWRGHAEVIDQDGFPALVKEAGLPTNTGKPWVVHSLRHSFVSLELLASGGDLRTTQERSGHASVEVMQGYMHAMGRGLPASRIGTLPPGLRGALATALPDGEGAEGADKRASAMVAPVARAVAATNAALVGMARASTDQAREFEEKRKEEKRAERAKGRKQFGRSVGEFKRIALAWIARGRPGARPPEVTAYADAHYRRAYNGKMRATGDVGLSKKSGFAARRATLAAWAVALRKVERQALAAPPLPETTEEVSGAPEEA